MLRQLPGDGESNSTSAAGNNRCTPVAHPVSLSHVTHDISQVLKNPLAPSSRLSVAKNDGMALTHSVHPCLANHFYAPGMMSSYRIRQPFAKIPAPKNKKNRPLSDLRERAAKSPEGQAVTTIVATNGVQTTPWPRASGDPDDRSAPAALAPRKNFRAQIQPLPAPFQ